MKLILCLLLTGCAVGSTTDPEVLKPPPIEPQRPAPVEPDAGQPDPIPQSCKLIRTIWGGNCKLDEYQCADGTWKLDGKCYPSWELPHQNDPDPPFFK